MSEAVVTERFPGWREAARRFMDGGPGTFLSDAELSTIFREPVGARDYAFQLMELGEHIRRNGHGLVRDRELRGYRLATDAEKVEVLATRELRVVSRALQRQRVYLTNTDAENLSSEQLRKRDHMLTSGGLIAAMASKARLGLRPPEQKKIEDKPGTEAPKDSSDDGNDSDT